MQSNLPQGDPRLQKTDPIPKVATGYVDPCIIYLEMTAPGEIPLIGIGWATSSREVRNAHGGSHLELQDVGLVKGIYEKPFGIQKANWKFFTRNSDLLILKHERGDALSISDAFLTCRFKSSKVLITQWKIKFLTPEVASSLQKILIAEGSSSPDWIAKVLLEQSKLNWPSISDALVSLKPKAPISVRRRPSFARRVRRLLISAITGKPVTA